MHASFWPQEPPTRSSRTILLREPAPGSDVFDPGVSILRLSAMPHDLTLPPSALDPKRAIERATLRGTRVVLEPLSPGHLPGLASAISDGNLWEIPVTSVPQPAELNQFLSRAMERHDAQLELAFATIDLVSGSIVGSTRFMNINRDHRRVEIGFTFIAKSWQRTHVNTEAKYLMLRHAFEEWGCNRVELLTDVLNTRSRAAILRLGAKEEGVLRSHMIMRDGRERDSVVHSIVTKEWPEIKSRLKGILDAA